MAIPIAVPSVGESITEGVVSQWLKKDGDFVQEGDPLFELETEKASQEIAAQTTGVLHISAEAGQTVKIGQQVGQIEPQEKPARKKPAEPVKDGAHTSTAKQEVKPAVKEDTRKEARPAVSATPAAPALERQGLGAPLSLAPSVRRIAAEEGIDVTDVPGTGRGGRVTKEDMINYLDQKKSAPALPAETAQAPAPTRGETRQRMSAIRQRIAERLVASQQMTATLTTFNEADLSAVMDLRNRYKDRFKEKHGVSLGFMSFFVKAAVEALKAFPLVNSRIEGNEIVTPGEYHIGVAVSTERGLMVPVVRNADRLSFADIEKIIAGLAVRAREGKITVDDLQGGTFTITNGGIFGSLLSTPILNLPQSGILGMHAIQKRPVVVEDQIVIRPMMYLALSYDHRIVDGRDAVQFLVRVKECVEDPKRMLLEI